MPTCAVLVVHSRRLCTRTRSDRSPPGSRLSTKSSHAHGSRSAAALSFILIDNALSKRQGDRQGQRQKQREHVRCMSSEPVTFSACRFRQVRDRLISALFDRLQQSVGCYPYKKGERMAEGGDRRWKTVGLCIDMLFMGKRMPAQTT